MTVDDRTLPQPRWLNDPEMQVWRSLIGMSMKLPAALDSQMNNDAGLTHFEYAVLVALSEAPDRTLRMSDLAAQTFGSQSRLSHVARRMQRNGLIARQSCPTDGRSTYAILTETGMEKLHTALPGHVEHVRQLVFDLLSDEEAAALGTLTQKILQAVEADSGTST